MAHNVLTGRTFRYSNWSVTDQTDCDVNAAAVTNTTDDRSAQERGSGAVLLSPVVGVLGVRGPGASDDCYDIY